MILVRDCDRRFSVESSDSNTQKAFAGCTKLTAREALRAASQAGPGARILVDGHPIDAEQLEPLASRDRRVSIACLTPTPNPQIESELADIEEKTDQLALPLL